MISVIALFDEVSTDKIKSYQNSITTKANDCDNIPHLTLAVYDESIEIDKLMNWVEYFCSNHKSLVIRLGAIGIFNKANIFALPTISQQLLQFYNDFHRKYNESCRAYFSPKSNEWFPHVGLLYTSVENAKVKLPLLMDVFEECDLVINRLRVTKKTLDGFVTVSEIDLG